MDEEIFIGYIGDYRVHDGRIKEITSDKDSVQVSLISYDGETILVEFTGVKSIRSYRPEGMILYSICEMKEQPPYRRFAFVNENEEDDAFLEIIALDCVIQ
jgi:hypothetical protein